MLRMPDGFDVDAWKLERTQAHGEPVGRVAFVRTPLAPTEKVDDQRAAGRERRGRGEIFELLGEGGQCGGEQYDHNYCRGPGKSRSLTLLGMTAGSDHGANSSRRMSGRACRAGRECSRLRR